MERPAVDDRSGNAYRRRIRRRAEK
jgi:hypothetical protein